MIGGIGEQWKRDRERRALSFAGALGLDLAAVQLHEVTHDRQPEAETSVLPRRRAVGLAEAVEEIWQELSPDSTSSVPHADRGLRSATLERQLDPTTGRR